MRVLQVMAGAEAGGAETAFVDLCIALHQTGVVQHVVTRPNKTRVPRLQQAGIPVTTLPFGGAIDLYTPWRIKHLIRAFKPDIAQTWMSRAGQKTPPCPKNATHRYLKICRLGGYYKLKHFPGADYFTTITPAIRDYLIAQGVDPAVVFHINNFADVDAPRAVLNRADYDTPLAAPLIVTLGRLHRAKAFDVLIEAIAQIPNVYLWIGGEGPEEQNLKNLAARLGVNDRVRFSGWITDRAGFMRAGDICVFPSRYEPFGTVFVQAWAQGLPLIASTADGPRQFVHDGVDGLLFPVDDTAALVAQLRRLIADPTLQENLRAAGRARFAAEFTKEKTTAAYIALYQNLCARAMENRVQRRHQ